LSGLSQATVVTSRVVSGKTKSINSGKITAIRGDVPYGKDNTYDILAKFSRTKLSPVFSNAVDVVTGKNVVGEPVTAKSVIKNLVVPLSLRDIYDAMKEQGMPKGAALSILSIFGDGLQTYDSQNKKKTHKKTTKSFPGHKLPNRKK
jgi:hypothetical protein